MRTNANITLTEKGTSLTFEGQSSALHPFKGFGTSNQVVVQDFLEFVQTQDKGSFEFLEVFAGKNETHFIIKAWTTEHSAIGLEIAPCLGYSPFSSTCTSDFKDLMTSIRMVALPGFSLTESSSDGSENSPTTFILEKFNNPTINLGAESVPFLDTTVQFAES